MEDKILGFQSKPVSAKPTPTTLSKIDSDIGAFL